MMAHQHLFVGGDRGLYETLRAKGIRELVKAITIAKGERIVSAQKLSDLLIKNGEDKGDFYLGFKDDEYLSHLCVETLIAMTRAKDALFFHDQYDLNALWQNTPSVDKNPTNELYR